MWRFRVVVVVVLVVLVPMPLMTAVHAQDQDAPLVVFVLDQRLATASPFFTGASGLSELERIFQNLGAQTQTVRDERLPGLERRGQPLAPRRIVL